MNRNSPHMLIRRRDIGKYSQPVAPQPVISLEGCPVCGKTTLRTENALINFPTLRLVLLFTAAIFLMSVLKASAASSPPVELAGRPVTMSLVKATGFKAVNWEPRGIKLTVEKVSLPGMPNINRLLLQNGIAPDDEAFTLIYDLNPAIKDFKDLSPGAKLQLPKIAGQHKLKLLKNMNYLVELTVDAQLRGKLNDMSDRLTEAARIFAQLPSERFALPDKHLETLKQIETLARWYVYIKKSYLQRIGPPLCRQSLQNLYAEAEGLTMLITAATASTNKLSRDDQEQISAIYHDLELVMKRYGQPLGPTWPKADVLYKVEVHVSGTDVGLIRDLRVYYIINGLFRDPPVNPPVNSSSFNQLGSDKSEKLPVKNYKIWAAHDGDPGHPLTPVTLVHVLGTEDHVNVDLSLKLNREGYNGKKHF
ncbi:MAG: hypothetical protein HQL08_12285 [Nitrospirae bacterium]|nr:hypothetical protein [Nitrospirota bacterium]